MSKQITYSEANQLISLGRKLSELEVIGLKEKLKSNPEDLRIRAMLISYYEHNPYDDTAQRMRAEHVLWIIKNHPDSKVAAIPVIDLDPESNGANYFQAKKLWLDQIKKMPNSISILHNAVSFLSIHDKALAEELLMKLMKLVPSTLGWQERINFFKSIIKPKEKGKGVTH